MFDEYPDADLYLSTKDLMSQDLCNFVLELISQGRSIGAIANETGLFRAQVKFIRSRNPDLRAARLKEEIYEACSDLERKKCEYFRQTTREGCERVGKEWDELQEKCNSLRNAFHHTSTPQPAGKRSHALPE